MEKLNDTPPSKELVVANLGLFYLSFFIFRILLHLVVDWKLIREVFQFGKRQREKETNPREKVVATFVASLFGLNLYWFYLINLRLLKMMKK